MTAKKQNLPSELAPCGVYCGACPSYEKSCHGCSSESEQCRKSKWNCKLRKCCYSTKSKQFCFECDEFPCKSYRGKLIDSHPGDWRFDYRHNLEEDYVLFSMLGLKEFLQYQKEKWRCSICGGKIHWYHYKCSGCGADFRNKNSADCKRDVK